MPTVLNPDANFEWEAVDEESRYQFCDSTGFYRARNIQVTTPVLLEVYGMEECNELWIDRYIGCGDGDLFIPYKCGDKRLAITVQHPTQLLYLPGRYKLFVKCVCPSDEGVDIQLHLTPLSPEIAAMYLKHQCCCNGVSDYGDTC